MNGESAQRVRSAAIAGWWTLLIATVFLAVQWVGYLIIIGSKPDWILRFWGGGDMDWGTIQTIWIWMTAVFKLIVWVAAMLVIWLSLWARRLART
jgi:hypothetical protein